MQDRRWAYALVLFAAGACGGRSRLDSEARSAEVGGARGVSEAPTTESSANGGVAKGSSSARTMTGGVPGSGGATSSATGGSGSVATGGSGTAEKPALEPWIYVVADNSVTKAKDLRALRLGEANVVDEVHLILDNATLGMTRLSPDRNWLVYTERNLESDADCLCFLDLTADTPNPQKLCDFTANRNVWDGQWYWNQSFIGRLHEYDPDQNLVATTYWQFDPAAPNRPVRVDMPPGYVYAMRVNADGVSAAITRNATTSLDTVHVGQLRSEAFDVTSLETHPLNTAMAVELSFDSQMLATVWTTNGVLGNYAKAGVTLYKRADTGWNPIEFPELTWSIGVLWGRATNRLLVNWGYPGTVALARHDGSLAPVFNATGPRWVDGDRAIVGRAAPTSNVAPSQLLWSRVDDDGAVGSVVSINEPSTTFQWVGGLTFGRNDREIVFRAERGDINRLYVVDVGGSPDQPRLLSADYETTVFAFDETRDRILVTAFEAPLRPLLLVSLSAPADLPPVRLPIAMQIDGKACFAPSQRGVITLSVPAITSQGAASTPATWYPDPTTGTALNLDQFVAAGYVVHRVFSRELGECESVTF